MFCVFRDVSRVPACSTHATLLMCLQEKVDWRPQPVLSLSACSKMMARGDSKGDCKVISRAKVFEENPQNFSQISSFDLTFLSSTSLALI